MVSKCEAILGKDFPLFVKSIQKQFDSFGESWAKDFDRELSTTFDLKTLESAVMGYGRFSFEALRLQKKFDKTETYENKTYEQASEEVYLNQDYMRTLYLPGLLLSHYLWPHHYRQKLWMTEKFVPLVAEAQNFCDVGVGSGFYSRFLLEKLPNIEGRGFDISRYSLEFTQDLIQRWNHSSRYKTFEMLIAEWKGQKFDCFLSVEVLEHLNEPVQYLKDLRSVVSKNAVGVITAAIDAPNRDHIYLYRNLRQIETQLTEAGFKVIDAQNFAAFERTSENPTVPQNGCFIVKAVS